MHLLVDSKYAPCKAPAHGWRQMGTPVPPPGIVWLGGGGGDGGGGGGG